jgi:HAE1 family hydrophobic/amphiphilic exporter-1
MNLTYGQGLAIKPKEFKIFMIMVPGTSQEHVSAEATQVENELLRMAEVKRVYSQVQGSQAQIMVSFAQLTSSTADAVNALSGSVASLEQSGKAQFHIVPMGGGGDEKTISLLFQGPSAEGLFELFSSLSPIFRDAPGVKDVIVRQGSPEPAIDMRVRHDSTGFHRVQAADAAHQLRAYLTGPIAAKVTSKERLVNVRVRAQRDRSEGLAPFQQYFTRSDEGEYIHLSDILDPIQRIRVSELQRENRRPVVRLSLVIEDADPLLVARHVTEALDKSDFPEGYNYAWGDEIHEILRARREMLTAVAMALGLIYIMLAAATNSVVRPVIIMVAVPFAGAAVVMALHLVGAVVNIPVYVGMIVLCGLVINVNIVMIHTMDKRVDTGESPGPAVIDGAARRLRPILMTALTTTLGALPMSIDRGAGSYLWAPLALTISVGVLSSSLFSLLLTPLLYSATIRTRSLQGGTPMFVDELANEKLT